MFTGIITDLGTVSDATRGGATSARFRIGTAFDMKTVDMGASIACNGCCLTVVEKGADWFAVDVSIETLARTTLESWTAGKRINLERSLKAGDEMGGHIVSGHIDGVATVEDITDIAGSKRFKIAPPPELMKFVAEKGSITLDGVSLTVNEVKDKSFNVMIIPHTQSVTSFGTIESGARLNMEIDVLARYVARILQPSS